MALTSSTFSVKVTPDFSEFDRQMASQDRKINSSSRVLRYKLDDQFSQPLGRITAQTKNFDDALNAATKRVLSFGVAVGILNQVERGFKSLISSTIEVEAALTKISINLKQNIGQDLFNVARQTGSTFESAAKAADLLARQGLSATETIKRLKDVLILSRDAGIDSSEAVKELTGSINTFKKEALNSTDILDKFTAVSNRFAGVTSKDLSDAIARSGETAQKAGINFNQLLGLITAVQSATQRGGAAISTSFNTIFEKIQQPRVLNELGQFGIQTKQAGTNTPLGGVAVLQNLASQYKNLNQAAQDYISTQIAGERQDNVFTALLDNLTGKTNTYAKAVKAASNAQGDAAKRNDTYQSTLQSSLNSFGNSGKQFASALGNQTVGPGLKGVLSGFEGTRKFLSGDKDSIGGTIGEDIVKGIANVLSGPGLILIGATLLKVLGKGLSIGFDQLKSVLGIVSANEQQAQIQKEIVSLLERANSLDKARFYNANSAIDQAKILLAIKREIAEVDAIDNARNGALYSNLTEKTGLFSGRLTGKTRRPIEGYADGYLGSAISSETSAISQGVGGASHGAKPVVIPNFNFGGGKVGPAVANTDEYLVPNLAGSSAIFNKKMIGQLGGVPNGAQNLGNGHIPNMASVSIEGLSDEQIKSIIGNIGLNKKGNRNNKQILSSALNFGNEDAISAVTRAQSNNLSERESDITSNRRGSQLNTSIVGTFQNKEGGGTIDAATRNKLIKSILDYSEANDDGADIQKKLNDALDRASETIRPKDYEDYKRILGNARVNILTAENAGGGYRNSDADLDKIRNLDPIGTNNYIPRGGLQRKASGPLITVNGPSSSFLLNELKQRTKGIRGFLNEPLNVAKSIIGRYGAGASAENKTILSEEAERLSNRRFQTKNTIGLGASFLAPFVAGFIPDAKGGTSAGLGSGALKGGLEGVGIAGLFGPEAAAIGATAGVLIGAFRKLSKSVDEFQVDIDKSNKVIKDNSDAGEEYAKNQEELSNAIKSNTSSDVISRLQRNLGNARSNITDSGLSSALQGVSDPDKIRQIIDSFQEKGTKISQGNEAFKSIYGSTINRSGVFNDFANRNLPLQNVGQASLITKLTSSFLSNDQLSENASGLAGVLNSNIVKGADRNALRDIGFNGRNGEDAINKVQTVFNEIGKANPIFAQIAVNSGNVAALAQTILASIGKFQVNLKATDAAIQGAEAQAKIGLSPTAFLNINPTDISAIAKSGQFGKYGQLNTPILNQDQKQKAKYESILALAQIENIDPEKDAGFAKDFLSSRASVQKQGFGDVATKFINSALGTSNDFKNINGQYAYSTIQNKLKFLSQSANDPFNRSQAGRLLNDLGQANNGITNSGGSGLYGAGTTSSGDYVVGTKYETSYHANRGGAAAIGGAHFEIKNGRKTLVQNYDSLGGKNIPFGKSVGEQFAKNIQPNSQSAVDALHSQFLQEIKKPTKLEIAAHITFDEKAGIQREAMDVYMKRRDENFTNLKNIIFQFFKELSGKVDKLPMPPNPNGSSSMLAKFDAQNNKAE